MSVQQSQQVSSGQSTSGVMFEEAKLEHAPEVQPEPEAWPSELRIALAMSGAIALVLYEAGVTHELFRLVKAWREFERGEKYEPIDYTNPHSLKVSSSEGYRELFEEIPMPPIVDVLTGASAGGINSIFLGSCLATDTDFSEFHELWIKAAGVERLKYGDGEAKSLLNSDHLRKEIKHVLTASAVRARGGVADESLELRVRLCRTDVRGVCRSTQDALGHAIEVETRSNIVEFETTDFVDSGKVDDLVEAALATSAFPVAFPPVFRDGRWYTDGGLWNNQPIDLAVQAIKDKQAYRKTNRCILFVEPNPTQKGETGFDVIDNEPSAAEILLILPTIGLKGDVWPALQQILNFNHRKYIYEGIEFDQELEVFLAKLGAKEWARSKQEIELAITGEPSGPTKPMSALNRLRLHATLFDGDPAMVEKFVRLAKVATAIADRQRVTAPDFERYALQALGKVGTMDLYRRAVRSRLESLNTLLREAVEHRTETARTAAQVVADTSDYKRSLYELLNRVNLYLQVPAPKTATTFKLHRSRFADAADKMLSRLDTLITSARIAESQAVAAKIADREATPRFKATEVLGDMLSVMSDWVKEVDDAAKQGEAASGLTREPEALVQTHVARAGVLDFLESEQSVRPLADEANRAVAMLQQPQIELTDLDYAVHLLAAVSDLIDKKRLDLIRISPNDVDNLHLITDRPDPTKSAAAQKLAGEGLGHLSGFLEGRWRRNDYVWGRLDACEILLGAYRKYGEREGRGLPEKKYQEILQRCHTSILRHEAALFNAETRAKPPIDVTKLEAPYRE